jgi:agmatine deiminase
MKRFLLSIGLVCLLVSPTFAQMGTYYKPAEWLPHEATILQWPHNNLHGPWYREDVSPTFVAMTQALSQNETVWILAHDMNEWDFIVETLSDAGGVNWGNLMILTVPTDDVWVRDNGPTFVESPYDFAEYPDDNWYVLDWGFNGWGNDTPYELCDAVPATFADLYGYDVIDLNEMVLEGGAIVHDGNGTLMATRSSIVHPSRNPDLTEAQINDYLQTYLGVEQIIWLDGVYGQDITDQHIDGFVKFANDSTIVTMNEADLAYWLVDADDRALINNAQNLDGEPYNIVTLPLTAENVVTTYDLNLGYKGSYCNYYIANEVVIVPTYNDPNDQVAIDILQEVHPERTVIGVDVRNLYAYGGMIACVTKEIPEGVVPLSVFEAKASDATLGRPYPNPATDLVRFNLSNLHGIATLRVTDAQGKIVTELRIAPGESSATLDCSPWRSGAYNCSLMMDGAVIGSRQLIVD